MPRRPHKKSRNGCVACKRRHIKCDEHRPRCVNCQTAGLDCNFASGTTPSTTTATDTETVTASPSETSTPDQRPQGPDQYHIVPVFTPSGSFDPNLNMEHLELLHQFLTSTYSTFNAERSVQHIWQGVVVRMAFSFPFLMHELLAISALHLAHCKPENASWYHTVSTELQTLALNKFNSVERDINASNCAAVLIFTMLLAVHILADPSRTAGLDSNQYLDHVINCVMLMRNVPKLIIQDWYEYLKETELKPMFKVQPPPTPYRIPQPCLDLSKLTMSPDLGDQTRVAYETAIERLHWVFAVSNVLEQRHTTIRWLLAWPVQLKGPFLESLNQRRPEALIILAYFAALMTFYRECWAVGDSGSLLIQAISSHLGPHWSEWMEWPMSLAVAENGG
ncbi:hypothetical protein, variant [Cladophialophora immunda]|uniref:Zn(2)-C6 fungal-type domain-containing protein n=1 Tax=Cladophialophora immunda TaxID=569365 RepID=A0A0D2APH2_9EURO|nr:uncharacterized protein PV07_06764 [Cladophialophora immunda]XP_016247199.1 hypothetical protein, variant [Cladophialophora immunda]KIW26982.1 hypothetical protein PV07_06764 [Cladophialophora immunda]KIW26983.1 hypothetical protein, variant [Cladophialophora immunda]OQV03980.1 Fungal Zn2-Cys6 binuclear cluster domain-containing protein [Cladophialophora immunda]